MSSANTLHIPRPWGRPFIAFALGLATSLLVAKAFGPPANLERCMDSRSGQATVTTCTDITAVSINEWDASVASYVRSIANQDSTSPFRNIELFELSCVHRADADLSFLMEARAIRNVTIVNAGVENDVVIALAQSPMLEELRMIESNVPDEAIDALHTNDRLRVFDVTGSVVSKDFVESFLLNSRAPLEHVGIFGVGVAPEVINECRERLPNVHITWDGEDGA